VPANDGSNNDNRRGRHLHARRNRRWFWPALTVGSFAGALAIVASIVAFYVHSDSGGAALRRQIARNAVATPAASSQSTSSRTSKTVRACSPIDPTVAGRPAGLVEAPEIGLDAPVVQGDTETQLAVAVGHVAASAWPDQAGTSVLVAHDVSWFSGIDHLHPGQVVRFVGRCATRWYTVTGGRVVQAGSPVYNTTTPRLVLVTCYPLDALFLTPRRYEVTATLTKVTIGGTRTAAPAPAAGVGALHTSLPTAVADDVGPRVTTTAPLGQLNLTGSPKAAWRQSTRPFDAAGSALELYFGALQIAETDPGAWRQVAPGVPATAIADLDGATVTAVPGPVTPTLEVRGGTVTGANVQTTVTLAGGPSPGTYTITMTATVSDGRLVITGWRMTP